MTSVVDHQGPIILFDGVCNLCTGLVQFVIQRDQKNKFRFASLQSPIAKKLLGFDAATEDQLETMILIDGNQVYRKSTAALRTTKHLNNLWPVLSILLVIPRPFRDMVYDWIGRRRYQFFGKRKVCWQPDTDLSDRFLN